MQTYIGSSAHNNYIFWQWSGNKAKYDMYLLGASLSEPHFSVTALHMRVCICQSVYTMLVWTDHLP